MSSVHHSTAEAGIRSSQVAPDPVREKSALPFNAFLATSNRPADPSLEPESRGGLATKDTAPSRLDESIGKRRVRLRDETHRASRRDNAQYSSAATPSDASTIRSVDRDVSGKPTEGGRPEDADVGSAVTPRGATGESALAGDDDSNQAPQAKAELGESSAPSKLPDIEGATPELVEQTVDQADSTGESLQIATRFEAAGDVAEEGSIPTPFRSISGDRSHFENAAGVTADQQLTLTPGPTEEPIDATLPGADPAPTVDASSLAALANASGDSAARQDAISTSERRGDRWSRSAAQATADGPFSPTVGHATITESSPALEAVIDVTSAETGTDVLASRSSDVTQQAGSATASLGSDPRGEARNPLSGRAEHDATAGKETLGPADASRFVSRVSRAVELAHQRGESLQIRLSPPELGSLRVAMAIRGGVLTAHLETETQAARIALLENLPALRERLAEQSVRLEQFDVDVRDESGGRFHERAPSFDDHRRNAPERPHREPRNVPATVGAGQSGFRPALTHLGGGWINLVV